MKKRFILLPLLLFVLAGCDPIVDPTDTGTSPTTTDPTTTDSTTTDPTTTDPTTTDPDDEAVSVPSVNLLAEYDKDDEVEFTDVEIISHVAANATLIAVTPEGILFVNYFGSPQYVKDDLADAVVGDHLALEGVVDIATGGDYARARTVKPSDVEILTESDWEFGKLIAETPEIDMGDGFGAWADALSVDSFARTYTWTNVVFKQTYGGSDPTGTGFHYFTYDASVPGKNTGVGGYYRVGFYKVDLSDVTIEDDGIYTVEGILGGTNKDMPFAAGANPSIRVSYLSKITKTGTVPSEPDPEPEEGVVVTLTVDALGLKTSSYSDNHEGKDVDGLLIGWTEIGNYGDGLQWRHKDDKKSAIFNVAASATPLLSIKVNYNGPKHGDVNVPPTLDYYVGNTSSLKDADTGFTAIPTVAGTFQYTVNFEASENITYFKLQKSVAQYGIYLSSIVLTFETPAV